MIVVFVFCCNIDIQSQNYGDKIRFFFVLITRKIIIYFSLLKYTQKPNKLTSLCKLGIIFSQFHNFDFWHFN